MAILTRAPLGTRSPFNWSNSRDEGLRGARIMKRKRARIGTSWTPGDRLSAQRPNQVWALGFAFELATDYPALRYLNITDEFTKKAPANNFDS